MSVVCSGNPSEPNAGVSSSLVIDAAYMQSLLPDALDYLYPYIPMLNGLAIGNVGAFCAADPPDITTLPTVAEFFEFVSGGLYSQHQDVQQYLQDVVRHYLWYSICHCTVVSTPAPPTPPADPGGLPAVNPDGIVSLPGVTPCYSVVNPTPITIGPPPFGPAFRGFPQDTVGQAITSGRVTVEIQASTGNFNVSWEIRQQTAESPVTTGHVYGPFVQGVGTTSRTIPYDPQYPTWAIYFTAATGTGTRIALWSSEFWCNGQTPGGTQTPCCPPDPLQMGMLRQILDYVELIQRQAVPFAYVYGSNHTGLTGDGEFAVSGILGVSIDVAALPDRVGVVAGTPETLFDVGYVTLGSADGWAQSRRIDREGALIVPPSGGVYTRVGYTLTPGVTVDIRELVREP